jgi:hypothetical protein
MVKKITLYVILIFSIVGCQKTKIASVYVTIEMENEFYKGYHKIQQLTIKKDGKYLKTILPNVGPFIPDEIKLDSLEMGNYTFEYINIFEQTISKELTISESKRYNLKIAPDYSDYEKYRTKSIINNLKNNHAIIISFKSVGCFHIKSDSIKIYKKNNAVFLKMSKREKKLTDQELKSLIKFECQLYQIPKGGCTSKDKYTVYFNNTKKEYIDNTCSWQGWSLIKEQMNLN